MLNVIMPENNTCTAHLHASSLQLPRLPRHKSALDSLLLSRFIANPKNVVQKRVYIVINSNYEEILSFSFSGKQCKRGQFFFPTVRNYSFIKGSIVETTSDVAYTLISLSFAV